MRLSLKEMASARLEELDAMGTVDQRAYALPLDNPDGGMTWDQLQSQQKREIQSGRWQIMAARHWFHMTLQAETEDEAKLHYFKAEACYWEAMHNAKGKKARLAKLPELGGRPKSEDIDILIELVDEISSQTNTLISAVRRVLSQNPRLRMRYGEKSDDYLRKIIRERLKEKNRP